MWKTKSHILKYKDPWVTLWQDKVEFSKKRGTLYGYIELQDGAHAVVIDKNNKIILFKEYRYPVKKLVWSIPGGGIDKNETPENAVRREIKEEIGVGVVSLKNLGHIWYFLPAFVSCKSYLFLARTDDNALNGGEDNEAIESVQSFSIQEILMMIDKGEIESASVANALQMAIRKIQSESKPEV